jgi:hypothetical protein
MTTFRIHFETGKPLDVPAEPAMQARKQATAARPGAIIRKIKVLKETGNG